MNPDPSSQDQIKRSDQAALRGEPSYVWRAGQQRRLDMIVRAAPDQIRGRVLDDGCGVGMYVQHLQPLSGRVFGLEYEFKRLQQAHAQSNLLACAAGEDLPYPTDTFDLVLSHEVLEHVADDHQTVAEIVRTLKTGGRLVLFVPNRGYPFETHGIYWKGKYHFGNIPLINYLPRRWRDRLAPHVRAYSRADLNRLVADLPVQVLESTIIFGAYDNLIARFGSLGKWLRLFLHTLEKTPLRFLGLSHFWVLEKTAK
jgi:SAM-dependent methyltransferase